MPMPTGRKFTTGFWIVLALVVPVLYGCGSRVEDVRGKAETLRRGAASASETHERSRSGAESASEIHSEPKNRREELEGRRGGHIRK